MSINDTAREVHSLLDQAVALGQPIPSLRRLRALIGGGSLTTISDAVKSWRLTRLEQKGQMPVLDDGQKLELGQLLWNVLQPELQKRIEQVQAQADKKVAIEIAEANKVREAASELLEEARATNAQAEARQAEFDAVAKENASLRDQIAKLTEEIERQEKMIQAGREREVRLQENLERAKEVAAAAEATVITIRRMTPFLDPKYAPKQ